MSESDGESTDKFPDHPRTRVVRERYEAKIGHLANITEMGMRSPAVRRTLVDLPPAEALFWLDQMIRGAVWGRLDDLDALLGFVFGLIDAPRGGDEYDFFEQLYRLAHEHDVRAVLFLLRNPPPHQSLSEEGDLPDVRLPLDRDDVPVGERRHIARKGDRDLIKRLTKDPNPLVIERLLENPDTQTGDVLKITSRRPTKPELVQRAAANPRWFGRRDVRKSLVMNPYTATGLSLKLLPTIGIHALRKVRYGSDLHPLLADSAEHLVDMRETYTSPWEV